MLFNPAVERMLVVLPNWVGDVVLATPALEALRRRFAAARISYLCRRPLADVVAGCGWADAIEFWPEGTPDAPGTIWWLARRLRRERFDLAVLFPNSLRSALLARLSRARQCVGYAREGRGWLLTHRLAPLRDARGFVPVSMLDYYRTLVEAVGCGDVGRRPRLVCRPEDEAALERRLGRLEGGGPLVVLNPGGAYGTAKLWPAERFAAVGDALIEEYGARVIVNGTPAERPIGEAIARSARRGPTLCFDPPLGLAALKALIRRADLLVTNDTGPRHYAVAFGVPVVTIFGPTDPAWTEAQFEKERKVMLALDCQPCQEKLCPLGHRNCMEQLAAEPVLAAARSLLAGRPAAVAAHGAVVRTGARVS